MQAIHNHTAQGGLSSHEEVSFLSLLVNLASCFEQINPRLQRHFMTFAIGMPSPTSLYTILETFLEGHLHQSYDGKRFQAAVTQVCPSLIKGALSLHQEVLGRLETTWEY